MSLPAEAATTGPAPEYRTRRRRRKEARPSELTAAALALFVEKGFAGTRLEDIALHAGVAKGTLYLYFDSKEALFRAVIEEGMVAVLAAAEQRLSDFQGSAGDLLQQLLCTWWEQIGCTPLAGVTKLIACESKNFPEVAHYYHEQVLERGRALLRTALRRGMVSGEFRRMDVEAAIDVIMAPLLMLAISRFSLSFCCQESTPETYLQTHFDLLLHGLRSAASERAAPLEGNGE